MFIVKGILSSGSFLLFLDFFQYVSRTERRPGKR
jgi:hypothetical protein